jgi:hypothetical protein
LGIISSRTADVPVGTGLEDWKRGACLTFHWQSSRTKAGYFLAHGSQHQLDKEG